MAEDKEKKYVKIGTRCKFNDGSLYFEFGYIPGCPGIDGWGCICFKDEEIYINEPDEICYMSESNFFNSFDEDLHRFIGHTVTPAIAFSHTPKSGCWTHNDILRRCENIVKLVPAYKNLNPEELAHRVFLAAIWTLDSDIDNTFTKEAIKLAEEMGENT